MGRFAITTQESPGWPFLPSRTRRIVPSKPLRAPQVAMNAVKLWPQQFSETALPGRSPLPVFELRHHQSEPACDGKTIRAMVDRPAVGRPLGTNSASSWSTDVALKAVPVVVSCWSEEPLLVGTCPSIRVRQPSSYLSRSTDSPRGTAILRSLAPVQSDQVPDKFSERFSAFVLLSLCPRDRRNPEAALRRRLPFV